MQKNRKCTKKWRMIGRPYIQGLLLGLQIYTESVLNSTHCQREEKFICLKKRLYWSTSSDSCRWVCVCFWLEAIIYSKCANFISELIIKNFKLLVVCAAFCTLLLGCLLATVVLTTFCGALCAVTVRWTCFLDSFSSATNLYLTLTLKLSGFIW